MRIIKDTIHLTDKEGEEWPSEKLMKMVVKRTQGRIPFQGRFHIKALGHELKFYYPS